MLDNTLFLCKNKDVYPPFKNGFYLEEYFHYKFNIHLPDTKRTFIPFLWTNFQIEHWFPSKKAEMQRQLEEWVSRNKNIEGYFTIIQYDDGCLLNLPNNTIVYGCCSGDIPIPLIYEDKIGMLLSKKVEKSFEEKEILCSFVGALTHSLRNKMVSSLKKDTDFVFITDSMWTPNVSVDKQRSFVETTCNSRFVLCPRGYGRNSFRFYEVLQLGCIPIYVWDDIEWLPYKNEIDYGKFCISININNIGDLKDILNKMDCFKYNEMISEYNNVKYLFTLEGVYDYIIKNELL